MSILKPSLAVLAVVAVFAAGDLFGEWKAQRDLGDHGWTCASCQRQITPMDEVVVYHQECWMHDRMKRAGQTAFRGFMVPKGSHSVSQNFGRDGRDVEGHAPTQQPD